MNKRGQVLVMFVLLIPVIIVLAALVVDYGLIVNEKIRLNSITRTVIEDTFDKKDDVNYIYYIKELYKENEIDTNNLIVIKSDNKVLIKNDYYINSIFGKMIDLKRYHIKTSYVGYMSDTKLIIEKG